MIDVIKFVVKRWYYGRRFKKSSWMVIARRNRLLVYMFLTQWLHWAENGAGKHSIFSRGSGLCVAWEHWCHSYYPSRFLLPRCLLDIIRAEFDNPSFPFGGAGQYSYESAHKTMHLNTRRITWAKKMAKIFWDGESFMDGEGRS